MRECWQTTHLPRLYTRATKTDTPGLWKANPRVQHVAYLGPEPGLTLDEARDGLYLRRAVKHAHCPLPEISPHRSCAPPSSGLQGRPRRKAEPAPLSRSIGASRIAAEGRATCVAATGSTTVAARTARCDTLAARPWPASSCQVICPRMLDAAVVRRARVTTHYGIGARPCAHTVAQLVVARRPQQSAVCPT